MLSVIIRNALGMLHCFGNYFLEENPQIAIDYPPYITNMFIVNWFTNLKETRNSKAGRESNANVLAHAVIYFFRFLVIKWIGSMALTRWNSKSKL